MSVPEGVLLAEVHSGSRVSQISRAAGGGQTLLCAAEQAVCKTFALNYIILTYSIEEE